VIDRTLHRARALVVDGNALSRTLLASSLRDLGLQNVAQSARLAEARLQMERQRFDIVLCEYHFDGSDAMGQDFLDELQRDGLLPWSSVFIMVTGEATYARVAEAAESALDGYLIKPFRTSALSERIVQARRRKKELSSLLQALDRRDWHGALALACSRFEQRAPYWPFAARLAAELQLQAGEAEAALTLYAAVRPLTQDPPWARLGIARALIAGGQLLKAREALMELRQRDPAFADACDVLGRLEMELGELEDALQTFRAGSGITPGCPVRLQQTGSAAFICGHGDEALDLLERTVSHGLRSKRFDAWTLLLIGLLRFDRREQRPLNAATGQLGKLAAKQQGHDRLRRLWLCAKALQRLLAGDVEAAGQHVREVCAEPLQQGLEPGVACAALALLARMPAQVLSEEAACQLAQPLVMRFTTSRASVLTLAAYARPRPVLVDLVHRCQREVTRIAEAAMEHALADEPARAIGELVQAAEHTLNRRLLDMAAQLLQRSESTLGSQAQDLADRIDELGRRCTHPGQLLAGDMRSARTPGGVVLAPAPAAGAAEVGQVSRTARPAPAPELLAWPGG
jgi:AmiR/NasT family two-component response regulator